MERITQSPQQTYQLGVELAQQGAFHARQVVRLNGPMGAGKTSLVKGILAGLGCRDEVLSPTFSICHRYDVGFEVLHYDLYRLQDDDDLFSVGFYEDLDSDACLLIEWAERAEQALADIPTAKIEIVPTQNPDQRIFRIKGLNESI